jgi:hypothetical protein
MFFEGVAKWISSWPATVRVGPVSVGAAGDDPGDPPVDAPPEALPEPPLRPAPVAPAMIGPSPPMPPGPSARPALDEEDAPSEALVHPADISTRTSAATVPADRTGHLSRRDLDVPPWFVTPEL